MRMLFLVGAVLLVLDAIAPAFCAERQHLHQYLFRASRAEVLHADLQLRNERAPGDRGFFVRAMIEFLGGDL